ncbi:MAG: hypothetical protein GX418_02370 [Clostridiales bacterium]|nr:hypothetical protein [Clostridiales bacterium]
MSCKRPNRYKHYVKVRADHLPDGTIKPLMFRDDEAGGEVCLIDQIMDVREAPSLKAGGQGIRYTCRVGERQVMLFHDAEFWFVELGE